VLGLGLGLGFGYGGPWLWWTLAMVNPNQMWPLIATTDIGQIFDGQVTTR